MTGAARTLLAFDYGTRRIGVAVGQELTGSATGLRTLASRGVVPNWDGISQMVREWQPDALVVGLPLHADGSENRVTKGARRFAAELEGRFHLPVYTVDERLSSAEASHLVSNRLRGADRASDIDRLAAQVILQTWLGQHQPPAER